MFKVHVGFFFFNLWNANDVILNILNITITKNLAS